MCTCVGHMRVYACRSEDSFVQFAFLSVPGIQLRYPGLHSECLQLPNYLYLSRQDLSLNLISSAKMSAQVNVKDPSLSTPHSTMLGFLHEFWGSEQSWKFKEWGHQLQFGGHLNASTGSGRQKCQQKPQGARRNSKLYRLVPYSFLEG